MNFTLDTQTINKYDENRPKMSIFSIDHHLPHSELLYGHEIKDGDANIKLNTIYYYI